MSEKLPQSWANAANIFIAKITTENIFFALHTRSYSSERTELHALLYCYYYYYLILSRLHLRQSHAYRAEEEGSLQDDDWIQTPSKGL